MSHRRPDDAPSSLPHLHPLPLPLPHPHLHPHLPNNNTNDTSSSTSTTTPQRPSPNSSSTTTSTTTSSSSTSTSTTTTPSSSITTSSTPNTSISSSGRPRTASIRKERILNNPPSTPSTRSSLHTRAVSRSTNLAHNNTPPTPHRDREHTRAKSTSLSASTSSRSLRPTPASTTTSTTAVVVTQHTPTPTPPPPPPPPTVAARPHRHTSIAPHHQQPSPAPVLPHPPRPATALSESLDALKARRPARFSSNGIATSAGPPPSLAYRRNTTTMDNRFSPRDTRGMTRENDRSNPTSSTFSRNDNTTTTTTTARREGRERGSSFSTKRNSIRVDSRANGYPEGYEQREGAMRGLEDLQNGGVSIENGELDGGELGGEDVFLNLARSNSVSGYTENSAYRAERRRSRLTQLTQHRNSLPADTFSASPLRAAHTHSANNRTLANSPAPSLLHDGTWNPNRISTPSSHYRDRRMSNASMIDTNGDDGKALTPRASFSRPLSMLRRERSPASTHSPSHAPSHTRSYSMAEPIARTRSSLANSVAPRQLHSSPNDGSDRQQLTVMIDRNQAASASITDPITPTRPDTSNDGADGGLEDSSSVSTTAPSTVWDELDDLKSRIRRLELTGRIPASGVGSIITTDRTPTNTNTSNSSGDRPRTATTTVTTISSSPRNNNGTSGVSPAGSTASGPSSNNHPLLHAALAKSKAIIAPEVYKYLEAAAHDAAALSGAVGSTGSPGGPPPVGGSMASERLVRRRADGVCRSLTELCIALSENRGGVQQGFSMHLSQHFGGRPASRDVSGGTVRERESILGRELGLARERDSILGRELGVGRERESMLGRDRSESLIGGRESSFGRESILGNRESMLARENSFGRESSIGDRLASRLNSRFAERKGSMASITTTAGFLQSSPRQQLADRDREPSPTTPGLTGPLRSRTSMLLKSRPIFDDEEDPENYRSPSRAATEFMTHRYTNNTHIMTPGASGALPPRRQYVTAHGTTSTGMPSPILHQRRFFSTGGDRSGDNVVTGLNSSYDGVPINERLASAVQQDTDYTARYRSGSMGRTTSNRRGTRGLRESVDLDSGAQGGSLGGTPVAVGRDRMMRR